MLIWPWYLCQQNSDQNSNQSNDYLNNIPKKNSFNVSARGLRLAPDVINIVFPPGLAVGHAFSRFFLNSSARPPWLARWSWCQSWWREKDIRRKRRRTRRKRLPQWGQNLFWVAEFVIHKTCFYQTYAESFAIA